VYLYFQSTFLGVWILADFFFMCNEGGEVLKRYGDIALFLSASLLSANLCMSMFRLISSGGVFASHGMLGMTAKVASLRVLWTKTANFKNMISNANP